MGPAGPAGPAGPRGYGGSDGSSGGGGGRSGGSQWGSLMQWAEVVIFTYFALLLGAPLVLDAIEAYEKYDDQQRTKDFRLLEAFVDMAVASTTQKGKAATTAPTPVQVAKAYATLLQRSNASKRSGEFPLGYETLAADVELAVRRLWTCYSSLYDYKNMFMLHPGRPYMHMIGSLEDGLVGKYNQKMENFFELLVPLTVAVSSLHHDFQDADRVLAIASHYSSLVAARKDTVSRFGMEKHRAFPSNNDVEKVVADIVWSLTPERMAAAKKQEPAPAKK
jgi:hypothetical protein